MPPKRLILFLIPAFCRLAKSLSHSQQTGWLVGAVGVEPTTNGLKDLKFIYRLQPTPVTNNRISGHSIRALSHLGPIVCEYPHKSRTPEHVLALNNSAVGARCTQGSLVLSRNISVNSVFRTETGADQPLQVPVKPATSLSFAKFCPPVISARYSVGCRLLRPPVDVEEAHRGRNDNRSQHNSEQPKSRDSPKHTNKNQQGIEARMATH